MLLALSLGWGKAILYFLITCAVAAAATYVYLKRSKEPDTIG